MRLSHLIFIILVIAIFVSGCSSTDDKQSSFFACTKNQKNYLIVEYGTGPDFETARQSAIINLSTSLNVEVQSNQRIQRAAVENAELLDFAESSSIQTKSKELAGVETVCQAQVDEYFYVAVSYDPRPVKLKLQEALREAGITDLGQLNAPSLIKSSALFNDFPNSGDGHSTVYFQLQRLLNNWYIFIGNKKLFLPTTEIDQLITNESLNIISFKDVKDYRVKRLEHGQRFKITVDNVEGRKYLTLYELEHDGSLAVIQANKEIEKGLISWPKNKHGKDIYIKSCMSSDAFNKCKQLDKAITNTVIAVLSDEKISTLDLDEISTNAAIIRTDNQYKVGELLVYLSKLTDEKNVTVSSKAVTIVPLN
jgi:hypothetical protein